MKHSIIMFCAVNVVSWNMSHKLLLCGTTLESIWQARNDTVFAGASISFKSILIRAQANLQSSTIGKLTVRALDPRNKIKNHTLQIGWAPLSGDSVTVNVDASVKDYGTKAGCGGVIRSSRGEFLGAFTKQLPSCSVLEAEMRAIVEGLKVTMERGWKLICLQSDSVMAIDLFLGGSANSHAFSSLIDSVGDLINEGLLVTWSKIPRDHNLVADALAKFSFSISCNCLFYDIAPVLIHPLLRLDKDGLANL